MARQKSLALERFCPELEGQQILGGRGLEDQFVTQTCRRYGALVGAAA
jgi:hypothetical protein